MAAFIPVRNVSPLGALDVVLDGDTHTVEPGAVIDIAPESAGKAPGWRDPSPAEAAEKPFLPTEGGPQEKPTAAGAAVERNAEGRIVRVWDLGHGLLAQPNNWQPESGETVTHPHELGDIAPAKTAPVKES